MRDLILAMIIIPGGLIALRHPFVGAMLWTWISIMNPHRMAWGFAYDAKFGMFVALCTLIGVLMTKEKRNPLIGTPMIWMVILVVWMCITTVFAYSTAESVSQLEKVLKIDLMVLVTLMLVRTKREMYVYAWVLAFSLAFYGIKGGIFTLMSGGAHRVWGPSGSYIEENNALALALIVTIPLLRFLQMSLQQAWQRHAMTAAMVLCGISALGSHSRGALLAISAMLLIFWWRGKNKFGTGFVIILAAGLMLPFMPEEWWNRMATIQTYEEDQSAMGRINAWWMAWNLANDRFFGGGFAIYDGFIFSLYAPDPTFVVSAHSIYFTMLGEHGFVGLFIYLALWIATWRSAGWLRKNAGKDPESVWAVQLGGMAQVSLLGFAVGGAFLSLAYFDLPYNLAALVVAVRYWVQTRGWEREPIFEPNAKILGIPLFFGDKIVGPSKSVSGQPT
ncbi:MAG: putative O-glycosylation ligase, exosortase A system-associated [Azoarcus sp.]|nr:putative O-glycosylation ligase, exosortase A system-associated [Azoarcus sp.]